MKLCSTNQGSAAQKNHEYDKGFKPGVLNNLVAGFPQIPPCFSSKVYGSTLTATKVSNTTWRWEIMIASNESTCRSRANLMCIVLVPTVRWGLILYSSLELIQNWFWLCPAEQSSPHLSIIIYSLVFWSSPLRSNPLVFEEREFIFLVAQSLYSLHRDDARITCWHLKLSEINLTLSALDSQNSRIIFDTSQPRNHENLTFWKTFFWSLLVFSKLWNLPQQIFRVCQIHCAAFGRADRVKLPSKRRSGIDSPYIQFQMNKIDEQIKFKIKTLLCANISSRVKNEIDFMTLSVSLEVAIGAFK